MDDDARFLGSIQIENVEGNSFTITANFVDAGLMDGGVAYHGHTLPVSVEIFPIESDLDQELEAFAEVARDRHKVRTVMQLGEERAFFHMKKFVCGNTDALRGFNFLEDFKTGAGALSCLPPIKHTTSTW